MAQSAGCISCAIGQMDEAEQIIFCGYYLDFKSIDLLADEVGLKKSQAYQIKEDALKQRNKLESQLSFR